MIRAEEAIKARIEKFAEQFIVGMDFNPDLGCSRHIASADQGLLPIDLRYRGR